MQLHARRDMVKLPNKSKLFISSVTANCPSVTDNCPWAVGSKVSQVEQEYIKVECALDEVETVNKT